MSSMADPLSGIAAIVSLADISIRTIRGLFKFLSKLATASAELRYLQRHLHSLESYVSHVHKVLRLYSKTGFIEANRDICHDLGNELNLCNGDLKKLERILYSAKEGTKPTLNRFGVFVKSVWKESEIAKISERLEKRKLHFAITLSALGRNNDLEILATLRRVQHSNLSVSKKITRNSKAVQYLLHGIDQTQETLKKGQRRFTQQFIQQTSYFRATSLALQAKNDQVLTSLNTGFRATRHQLTHLQSDNTANKEKLTQLTRHVHAQLNQMDNALKGLNGLCFNISRDKKENVVIINGSAQRAAASLSVVFEHLPKIFTSLNHRPDAFTLSSDDMEWLEEDFKSLLAAVSLEAHVELTGGRRKAKFTDKRRPTQPIRIQELLESDVHNDFEKGRFTNRARNSKAATELRETKAIIDLPIGKFTIFISETCPKPPQEKFVDGVRLLFFPRSEFSICGFSASSTYDWRGQVRVYPLLSTFGILSGSHEVWNLIEIGDVISVCELLGDRHVHPNDRDADYGNTLLGWATWNHQKEICELLVREGADPLNCDSEGYSALSIFYRSAGQTLEHSPELVDVTRALISASDGGDIVEHDKHIDWKGTITGVFSHGIVHRAILEMFPSWKAIDCSQGHFESLELLLQSGGDPNERNGWGRTPLLTAAFQVRLSSLPRIMRLLLKYGANPLLFDGDGEGILHRLLYAFGSCGIRTIDETWTNDMVDILASLLQSGCDPNLKKDIGWTPSDNALSPIAWMIWCEALSRAGHVPEEVVMRDDDIEGIIWGPGETILRYENSVQLYRDRRQSRMYDDQAWHDDEPCCRICKQNFMWNEKHPPFDFMGTYLNTELNYHQQLYNHSSGRFCPKYFSADNCSFENHDAGLPPSPTLEQLSWRKHVALDIWRESRFGHSKIDLEA